MSAEERMNTLLSETEDVAREDQIFLREGAEMAMAERKRGVTNRNTSELGQPTTANGNPPVANLGTKLNKNYEKAIADIENLIKEKGSLSAHEFLHELDNALTGLNEASTEGSDYIDIGDGFTIRVSDHYSNANTFKRFNNKEKNFGVVIKLKNRKFKSDPNVDYVEVVYYPDKLDSSRQLSILEGVKGLVETKDIGEMPEPDDTHTSEKTNFSLITPEMDADYLSAVERGDMEKAQQMVMEAAKLAMPNTKVVDDDGNPKVVYHQTNHSAYINRETGQNWDELDWRERMEWDERDDWDEYWEERDFNTFSRVNARTTNELDGFFFAPEYDEYHEYGERTIAAFLNIENPASNGDYHIDASKTNAGRDERIRMQNEGYDGVINKEDGAVYEYIAFNPNQIKSADPVTYDDNGNIIPLSERFNPENEDIRYSLSYRPTGLLNDFAEEFEALQKEYESLDPTTLHAHHPFRVRKRKVVQKYLNYVSEVLGLPCEAFVLDSSNEQQVRTAYRKYIASRQANGKTGGASYEEFKEEISDAIGEYFFGTDMVFINIGIADSVNINSEYLAAALHENEHKIIEGMNIGNEMLEAIYEEAQRLAPKQVERVDQRYGDESIAGRGEEIITFALQTRASFSKTKELLMQYFEGKVSEDDILKSFNNPLPLRDKILKDTLIALRDGYNNKNNEHTNNGGDNNLNGEAKEEAMGNGFGGEHLRSAARGVLLTTPQYSLNTDMPFFEDNGDIVIFDELTAEEQKMARLEEAKALLDDNEDAQSIYDKTGWVISALLHILLGSEQPLRLLCLDLRLCCCVLLSKDTLLEFLLILVPYPSCLLTWITHKLCHRLCKHTTL